VRIVQENTGLDDAPVRDFVTFILEGTPTGTMCAHGYLAQIQGRELLASCPEGPARAYPIDDLPSIVPVRVTNQRSLDAYLLLLSDFA
jgi:hypothetical protein